MSQTITAAGRCPPLIRSIGRGIVLPFAPLAVSGELRNLIAATFVSTIGDRLHQIALVSLLLGLTGSIAPCWARFG